MILSSKMWDRSFNRPLHRACDDDGYLACGHEHGSFAGVRVGGNVIGFLGCRCYGGDHGVHPSDCENDHAIAVDEHGRGCASQTLGKMFL